MFNFASNYMKEIKTSDILDFLGDLSCPTDPFVFTGYGTEYQKQYTKEFEEGNPFLYEAKQISEWVSENKSEKLYKELINILDNPPLDYCNQLPIRRKFDWDYAVSKLIIEIGIYFPNEIISQLLSIFKSNEKVRTQIIEIFDELNNNQSNNELEKIYKEREIYNSDVQNLIKEIIKEKQ